LARDLREHFRRQYFGQRLAVGDIVGRLQLANCTFACSTNDVADRKALAEVLTPEMFTQISSQIAEAACTSRRK